MVSGPRLRKILGYVGESGAVERSIAYLKDVVEYELSVYPYLQFATVPFKIPRPQSTMGGQAKVDTVVGNKVLR